MIWPVKLGTSEPSKQKRQLCLIRYLLARAWALPGGHLSCLFVTDSAPFSFFGTRRHHAAAAKPAGHCHLLPSGTPTVLHLPVGTPALFSPHFQGFVSASDEVARLPLQDPSFPPIKFWVTQRQLSFLHFQLHLGH